MASQTLNRNDVFPVGTVVDARLATNWQPAALPPTGAPPGAAATTATVQADGSLTFTGLADDTPYYAYAQVGGVHRYVGFRTARVEAITRDAGTGAIAFEELIEQGTDPAAPVANRARLFAKDNGAGKTQLVVRFPTGATQVIATEP